VFEIMRRELEPMQVVAPNGGELWLMGQRRVISWSAPASVTAVDIDFSTDGGANWQRIDSNVASTAGNMQYLWYIPTLGLETDAARVRVRNTALSGQRDISDRAFSIRRGSIAGIVSGETEGAPALAGIYPNPASDRAEIRWEQRIAGDVEIALYTADGARAEGHAVGLRAEGEQRYMLDVSALASGMYLYEVRAGGSVAHGVMGVMR
jgi:hypothetical protein